jgi:uncharacterized membrane protein
VQGHAGGDDPASNASASAPVPAPAPVPVPASVPVPGAPDDLETRQYPLVVRIYGVLCIVAGGLQVVSAVLVTLLVFVIIHGVAEGRVDLSQLAQLEATGHASATTLVIGLVALVITVVLAAMFFVLGIRLLRNKHHKVATLANAMIGLEAIELICHFMLVGLNIELLWPGINMAILIALEAYSDPSLREERERERYQRELEDLEAAVDGTLGRDPTGEGYIKLNFFNVFWVFVICCVIGLVLEVIWHMVVVEPGVYQDRAGLLYGPFSPIYGFGAVLMTVALNRYYRSNPLVIFLVAGFIGAAFEFFVSWFLETAFGIVAWDYTGTFLSIGGRTNFMFFCIWGLLGLVWVRYALPLMLQLVNRIPWNWRYSVTAIATVLMLTDGILTLASLDCWYQRADGTMNYENPSAIVAFCNEHYDDAFMEHRFQSMTVNPEISSRA